MDVRTISVVAVVLGTAAYALYEYLFNNEANRQHQYSHGPRRSPPIEKNNSRNSDSRENKRNEKMERNDELCSICMNSLLKGVIIGTSCNHQFHFKCLSNWIKKRAICPLCRKTIKLDDVE